MNKHGVLNYVPFNFADVSRKIDGNIRFGSKDSSPMDNIENRITVQGQQIALNENLILTMDDRSKQQSKYSSDILENSIPIFDASITSTSRAKTVARQILKANASVSGSLRSDGHPNLWDVRPGDIIEYDGNRLTILKAQHRLSNALSNFTFLSTNSGLEGVLQGIKQGSITETSKRRPDKTNQIHTENFSFFDNIEIIVTPTITITELSHAGFLIGRNSERGVLGGNNETIGLIEKETIIIEGES